MKLHTLIVPLAALMAVLATTNVGAGIINFIDLTEKMGGLGESSWSTLSASDHPDLNFFGLQITGHASVDAENTPGVADTEQFAYLDWGNAGLGVCKDADGAPSGANPNSPNNSCAPRSDDNVTHHEYLAFMFDQDVVVENLWFNNNHDGGFNTDNDPVLDPDLVDIGIDMSLSAYAVMTGYAGGDNGIGPFLVKQGQKLHVAFNNEQFYLSGMQVSAVPVPAAVWLFGTAMAGFLGFRRRVGKSA